MNEIIWATPLYLFLKYCNESPLDKVILDCGAGGESPPLALFYQYGYKTNGIDISDKALEESHIFCTKNKFDLNIIKGDMREIPFEDESMSFVYSLDSIIFLSKAETRMAIKEIERVLRTDGLCFINFKSIDDEDYNKGEPMGNNEFKLEHEWTQGKMICSFYEDNEPNAYFNNFKILRKEKRVVDCFCTENGHRIGYIDYISRKK
ncbi:MAG: class I SAM-dependent methyltransferase [Candidatus Thorarchaeota archaeon]